MPTSPNDAVRARRRLTNKLIAAHDAGRLRPFFAPDVRLIVGDGSLILGVDAVLDAFAAQFADPSFKTYVRETQRVEPDAQAARAAEHGHWIAYWGEVTMTGTYLAVWRKVTGQWVIESELYVTLT
jgi:ketosteroid isomerase-like protein